MCFAGCDDGPKVETCVIDTRWLQCSYDKGGYAKNFDDAIGYVCFKPKHFGAMVDACSKGDPVAVDPCILGLTDVQCPDKRYTLEEAKNYVCLSSYSLRKVVKWCVENE